MWCRSKGLRKIEFRGKSSVGKWIYGDFVSADADSEPTFFEGIKYAIRSNGNGDDGVGCSFFAYPIPDENTIGQYIGLVDIQFKKIFEGDIIKTGVSSNPYLVYWEDGGFHIEDKNGHQVPITQDCIFQFGCKVVGNKFDNKDEDLMVKLRVFEEEPIKKKLKEKKNNE